MYNTRMFKISGTFLYYLLWPLVWLYAPLRVRVRVLLLVDCEVAVVKNWFGPNNWQFPGGGMKFGEQATDTALREIREELGITIMHNKLQQVTDEPEIVRFSGLLFRYHYVISKFDTKPKFVTSREIVGSDWVRVTSVKIPRKVLANIL